MTKPAGWSAAAVAPDRALPPGTRVDDYEIEQTLAEGGVAIVYRAFDHALGLQVALEEYMPEAMALRSADGRVVLRTRVQGHAFEEGRQAFIGEAQTLARCAHPALLRIDRVLQRNGTVYRAMRLCTGPTLLEHRRTLATPPDAATLQRWLEDLLGALEALHAEGCVHGALAPDRILLRDDGHVLLLGFDAVRTKLISGRTQDMMAALEPSFAAPELRNPSPAQAAGPWTDLYALATTLRYCMDGELPPPATRLVAAQPAVLVSDAWRLASHEADAAADAAWLRAIDVCLADAPQDRPQSVARLRQMIDEALFASTLPAWPAPRIAPVLSGGVDAVPEHDASVEAAAAPAPGLERTAPEPEPECEPELAGGAAAEPEPAPGADAGAGVEPEPGTAETAAPKLEPRIESAPANAPAATDAAIAHMLADLEQTLARVAAMASEDADSQQPAPAPEVASATAFAATSAPAQPPAAWRRELYALWQRRPSVRRGLHALGQRSSGMQRELHLLWQRSSGVRRELHAKWQRSPDVWPTLLAQWQRRPAVWVAAAVVVGVVGLLLVPDPRAPDGRAASDAAPAALTAVQLPPPTTAGTRRDALAKLPPAPGAAKIGVEPASPPLPTMPQLDAGTSAALPQSAAVPPPPVPRPRPAPSVQCRGKSGYALYQCMQTQCAKRSYAKHAQCVRLRRSQTLN